MINWTHQSVHQGAGGPRGRAGRRRAAWRATLLAGIILAYGPLLRAQAPPAEPPAAPPEKDEPVPKLPDIEMKPTDVGLRFTPGMARAISGQLTRQMTRRYELSNTQAGEVKEILARQMMQLAQAAQYEGRETLEFMFETMIENDGNFPPEAAQKFAKDIKPIFPHIERFFTDTAKQISSKMTLTQRLKFTGDSAPAVAGLALFKSRMEKWERGEAPKNANPFMDREDEPPASQASDDPRESKEIARARRQADNTLRWEVDQGQNAWSEYVERAITYYGFDEGQQKSARAILKEAQERAAAIKTPQWRAKIRENRTQKYLSYQVGMEYATGPWMFKLDTEYENAMKPVNELYTDLRRRIDALATTAQRFTAQQHAREAFDKVGVAASRG